MKVYEIVYTQIACGQKSQVTWGYAKTETEARKLAAECKGKYIATEMNQEDFWMVAAV